VRISFFKKEQTIKDFGHQWQIHGQLREDYWSSNEMFRDHFPKNFDFSIFHNSKVLEIGSGSGRILHMLSSFNPSMLIGIEPSNGFSNLVLNTNSIPNLRLENTTGTDFDEKDLDVIVSLGVIHHIPEADDVVHNAFNSLKKGGYFIIWVYGYENNRLYVILQKIIRIFARFLPDFLLDKVSLLASYIFDFYGVFSRILFKSNLPLTGYYNNVFSKCGRREKKYIIFDQLNPSFAKYYTKSEVIRLLNSNGFIDIEMFHRHRYSWTAIAKK
jgi:SAM-dependent methyltransferase